jgi:hypothetical protein
MQSFRDMIRSFFLYRQMVFRLTWRARLSADFAEVMAVEGQIRREEARCLYDLAREAPGDGVIVEIGSYRGLSTVALAKGSLKGNGIPVYAIDPHQYIDRKKGTEHRYDSQDQLAFLKNILLSGVAEMVRPVHLLSWEVAAGWDKPISLLWIDGSHEYEAVRKDFVQWSPFLVPCGHLAFHDSNQPDDGPYRVVQEALASGSFGLMRQAGRVTVLRRRKKNCERTGMEVGCPGSLS